MNIFPGTKNFLVQVGLKSALSRPRFFPPGRVIFSYKFFLRNFFQLFLFYSEIFQQNVSKQKVFVSFYMEIFQRNVFQKDSLLFHGNFFLGIFSQKICIQDLYQRFVSKICKCCKSPLFSPLIPGTRLNTWLVDFKFEWVQILPLIKVWSCKSAFS